MLHWGETLLTFMGRFHSCRCPCVCYLWLDLITYKKAFVWAVFRQGKRFPLLYTWNQHNNCKSIIRQYKIKSERGKKITKSAFALGGPVDKIVFPLQGVRVLSPVREQRSHLPQAMTKKKKKKERDLNQHSHQGLISLPNQLPGFPADASGKEPACQCRET